MLLALYPPCFNTSWTCSSGHISENRKVKPLIEKKASDSEEATYSNRWTDLYKKHTAPLSRAYPPTQTVYHGKEIKKHLNLLDGIAVLLLTESQLDVVATTFIQTHNSIMIEFARNSAVKAPVDYIDKVLYPTCPTHIFRWPRHSRFKHSCHTMFPQDLATNNETLERLQEGAPTRNYWRQLWPVY